MPQKRALSPSLAGGATDDRPFDSGALGNISKGQASIAHEQEVSGKASPDNILS
jgi:hypothetical protein